MLLDYGAKQYGYICFDPITDKFYVNIRVIFNELVFSFSSHKFSIEVSSLDNYACTLQPSVFSFLKPTRRYSSDFASSCVLVSSWGSSLPDSHYVFNSSNDNVQSLVSILDVSSGSKSLSSQDPLLIIPPSSENCINFSWTCGFSWANCRHPY